MHSTTFHARLAIAIALVTIGVTANANDLVLLEIPGLKGPSTVPGFEGQIELTSWNWGLFSARDSACQASELSVNKYADNATAELIMRAVKPWSEDITLRIVRLTQKSYESIFELALKNAEISGFSSNGSVGGLAIESVSIRYSHVEGQSRTLDGKGNEWEPFYVSCM
jgi:type VI protein secretion system component Hcp